ncbi:MAG: RluA family pseudouridine synthase [Actinomycetaceae bacterium]|nr:RluA family pseudouridine synthase [Actinomycetaceae bacterium]
MNSRFLPVPDGLSGQRADLAISRMLGIPRAQVAALIDAQQILIDNRPILRSQRLKVTDILDITLPEEKPPGQEPTPVEGMEIVYDDADIVVVNKPVGVAAHTGPGWSGPTVVGALRAAGYRVSTSGPPEREGIVHRLDVGTSGLMAVAKSELAYSRLKNAFRRREVTKIYHTLVQGHVDPPVGTIEAPIGRHPSKEFKMGIVEGGKHAVTHYDLLELMPGASLLEVNLETGRTHQIRVHMSAIHHPCIADPLYGADLQLAERLGLERQWLHAVGLRFEHPITGVGLELRSEYPADLLSALESMRNGLA